MWIGLNVIACRKIDERGNNLLIRNYLWEHFAFVFTEKGMLMGILCNWENFKQMGNKRL